MRSVYLVKLTELKLRPMMEGTTMFVVGVKFCKVAELALFNLT